MASITVDTGGSLQGTWASIVTVMNNLGSSAASFMLVVQAFSYTAGIFFLGMGIVYMTKAANPTARNTMQHGNHGTGWFWSMVVGVLLFSLPSTMAVLHSVMYDGVVDGSPLAYSNYVQGGNLAVGSCKLGGLRPLFVVFGFIACIRGLIVLRAVGMHHHGHNVSASRGVILCGAGISLVNMQAILGIINGITGLSLGSQLC
jgi:hypothetical protein